MLKHIVFFKFKEETTDADIEKLTKGFRSLPPEIGQIREYLFGKDIIGSERSYDYALISSFDSLDAMKEYQVHPLHKELLVYIRSICSDIRAVDFEH